MSVKINIINSTSDRNSQEAKAAEKLQHMLTQSISKEVSGEIIIAHNLTLCGQDVRDVDLLLLGKLENCVFQSYYTNDVHYPKKDLVIDGFCITIELKGHKSDLVKYEGTHIYVNYNGWKDATDQNEKQRYSFKNYFKNECYYEPKVSNFVWLNGVTPSQFKAKISKNPIGALPSEFTFRDIINTYLVQGIKPSYDKIDKRYHIISSSDGEDVLADARKYIFNTKFIPQGQTKKRIEILKQETILKELDNYPMGEKLTILEGKAGTGKTFRLIQAALRLATKDSGKRCVILTYNHALVSDIRRLLHFLNIPDGIDTYTVQIQTLHSFFIQLMKALGIETSKIFGNRFEIEYKKALEELNELVIKIMDSSDIDCLKSDNKLAIDWDYVFIDEGQDWPDVEKNILFKIYGLSNIIVADGVDQFSRGVIKQKWGRNVLEDNKFEKGFETGQRQHPNLVNFVNAYAKELGLNWKIEPEHKTYWSGGQVFIIKEDGLPKIYPALLERLEEFKCDNYDFLFLVPPSMVTGEDEEKKHFVETDKWKEEGIVLFDGTSNRREQYPTKAEECRMFQYDSCRGLESWITVCLKFDEFIEYKKNKAKDIAFPQGLTLDSEKDRRDEYVKLWSLIPLTRPMDTLIITLDNPNSEIGKILKKIANNYSDYVKWLIK